MLACDAIRLDGPKRVVPPTRPNVGLEVAYRKRLDALLTEMHASLVYWLKVAYRAKPPEMAEDATRRGSPASIAQAALRKLQRRWLREFNQAAPKLASYFAQTAASRADGAMASMLKTAGLSVDFKLTPTMNDVLRATINEQISLIKSIASQHLSEVEGLVMRSVQEGRQLGTLTKQLETRYRITRKRAALIARDQNNKATASFTRVRQQDLGITQAIWVHSSAGKHPRPEHVAANGKTYDVAKGMYLEGVWTWPGREINCRCVSRSVIPGL